MISVRFGLLLPALTFVSLQLYGAEGCHLKVFTLNCEGGCPDNKTVTELLSEQACEFDKLRIRGLELDLIPDDISAIVPSVTKLELINSPSRSYEVTTGLFKNMTEVTINEKGLVEMRLNKDYPRLDSLIISNTKFATVDPSLKTHLPNLRNLFLSFGQLSSLTTIKEMCLLEQLILNDNNITKLEVDDTFCWNELRYLNLEKNKLESIMLNQTKVPNLSTFRFDYVGDVNEVIKSLTLNQLGILAISGSNTLEFDTSNLIGLPRLHQLEICSSNVQRIPRGNQFTNTKIKLLSLENNQIKTISSDDLRDWSALTRLYLAKNQITSIEARAFAGTPLMKRMDLDQNNISSVDNDAFVGIRNLKTLRLCKNPLKQIPDEALAPIINASVFQNC